MFPGPQTFPSLSATEASPAEAVPSAQPQECSFFVRMKSTLTKRGLHLKASGYKVGVGSCPDPQRHQGARPVGP